MVTRLLLAINAETNSRRDLPVNDSQNDASE
jgi:hypothetical protein